MNIDRRELLTKALLAGAAASSRRLLQAAPAKLGIPGPYPGRVVAVHHPGSIVSGAYQAEPIRQMMRKGMMELTGAPSWVEAWRVFAQPGDVVGIKVAPVGGKKLCSDPTVFNEIVEGLKQAGLRPRDIVAYDRYRREFLGAGFHTWLPEGVRWTWAAEAYDEVQLGMDGFDPDQYMEIPVIKPGQDYRDAHVRRSYVARFLTKEVNKFVNLPVLKHHRAAGVTMALKGMAYGMVNNINRSHQGTTVNLTGVFIPTIVDLPVFREKAVLHIVDGVKGGYDDGPGVNPKYIWEHKTIYFATDPVAIDKIGWRAIDKKRAEQGLPPVALAKPAPNRIKDSLNLGPEHIEVAGALGLGVFDDAKIDLKKVSL